MLDRIQPFIGYGRFMHFAITRNGLAHSSKLKYPYCIEDRTVSRKRSRFSFLVSRFSAIQVPRDTRDEKRDTRNVQ